MALSLPIINNLITEKITSLNNTVNSNDVFYKTCILNLTSQLSIITGDYAELKRRIEELENFKNTEPKQIIKSGIPICLNYDKPPGLYDENPPPHQTKISKTSKNNNTRKTSKNNDWQTVTRKKSGRNHKFT
jgi:hypothetical protein